MWLSKAREIVPKVHELLKKCGATKVETTGSVLREEPDIGDIDIIIAGDLPKIIQALEQEGCNIGLTGKDRVFFQFEGTPINVFVATEDNWGAMQLYLTGPTSYTIAYRIRAKKYGFDKLDQYGLWKDGKVVIGRSEAEIYEAMGKSWKHPNRRGK